MLLVASPSAEEPFHPLRKRPHKHSFKIDDFAVEGNTLESLCTASINNAVAWNTRTTAVSLTVFDVAQ